MYLQGNFNQNNYATSFGKKIKLSEQTIKAIEKYTKLTYSEMRNLPLAEYEKLMTERGTLKKTNKLKTWISEKYRKLGERFGLIEKQYNIYTDID